MSWGRMVCVGAVLLTWGSSLAAISRVHVWHNSDKGALERNLRDLSHNQTDLARRIASLEGSKWSKYSAADPFNDRPNVQELNHRLDNLQAELAVFKQAQKRTQRDLQKENNSLRAKLTQCIAEIQTLQIRLKAMSQPKALTTTTVTRPERKRAEVVQEKKEATSG